MSPPPDRVDGTTDATTASEPVEESTIGGLRERIHGDVLQPGEDGYDDARTIWNSKIDKYPAAVLRCTGAADVVRAVDFARENDLQLAVKGGGHGIAGHAVCDDGLVVDLAPMNGVRVDPEARTVRVQAGATWGDVNHELHSFGLEIVGITYDEVGVAGFTLGGGMGQLSRQHGLAIDNLRAVDVVTADGALLHANTDDHPDLFWALRGGSGNFGVVTSFQFDCHEVTPDVLSAVFLHPVADARDVIRRYRDFVATAPNEVMCGTGVLRVPEGSDFPEALHGETVAGLIAQYVGDVEVGKEVLQPLQAFGDPLLAVLRPEPLSESGTHLLSDGMRNHWKNHYLAELSDEAIDTFVEQAVPVPTPSTVANFYSLGGAINEVDEQSTAYPHREATHLFELATQWQSPEDDEEAVSWAREFHEAMAPYATGGEYVNNQTDDDIERARAAYGTNYDRLAEIKTEWDPENLFRMNQNIEPAA